MTPCRQVGPGTAVRRVSATVAAVLLGASWVGDVRADTPVSAQASAHFSAGVAHLEGQAPDRYHQAYREFKAAYAATPTWKILGNLGIAAQELERFGEAADAFEGYLGQGGDAIGARERQQVQRDLDRLRFEQATVTLEAPEGPMWIVDTRFAAGGARVVNRYGPFDGRAELRVRAGQHEFRIDRPRFDGPAWTVTLLAGDASSHSFQQDDGTSADFEPSATESVQSAPLETDAVSVSHTPAYVLWGVGALSAAVTTVLFFESGRLQNEADDEFAFRCPLGLDPTDDLCMRTTAMDARAARWRTATVLTGIGAATALLGGTVLYWLDVRSASQSPGNTESRSLRVWFSPASIGLNGIF